MNFISLIGYRASGKTTLAKYLASSQNWQMLDLDQLIQEQANSSIAEIVRKEGWEGFRKRENKLLYACLSLAQIKTKLAHLARTHKIMALQKNEYFILSTGGGIILDPRNRNLLKNRSKVFFLHGPATLFFERLQKEPLASQRPPLPNQNLVGQNLENQREVEQTSFDQDSDSQAIELNPEFRQMKATLDERLPLYLSCAHYVLDATLSCEEMAKDLLAYLEKTRQ